MLLFLSHKCVNKYMHLLAHKQIYYIASSAHITSVLFCAHSGKLQIILKYQVKVLRTTNLL